MWQPDDVRYMIVMSAVQWKKTSVLAKESAFKDELFKSSIVTKENSHV